VYRRLGSGLPSAAAGEVSLNSSRPLRTLRCEGTIIDESPALTN
jgi:hypothetical protein